MSISTQDFTTLVRNQVAAIQGAARTLVDLTVGSILRACVEANAAVVLWLQGLILRLLAVTRAATSSGADLDSWVGDFGVTRLVATAASGQVTFARFTTTLQAVVPVGSTVQTGDGSQAFTVGLDTTNSAYSATLAGYVLAAGVSSIAVPVTAATAGAGANVSAGQINTITQAMPGVDTVTNALAFTNGSNAETDAALRTRFVAYVQSLSKATKNAIGYAITSLKAGVTYTLVENFQYNGTPDTGYFYVVVDDGTGTPPSPFLSTVYNAIDVVRGLTIRFGVFAPVVVNATISMSATIATGYDPVATKAAAQAAIVAYVNALQLGQSLPYTRIAQVGYVPGVTNLTAILLNGAGADITATAQQVIKTSSAQVTVS